MIPIFDLDDTLYPERTYVESGFRTVALWGEQRFGWPAETSLAKMLSVLERDGRGRVFDRWLATHGAKVTRRLVGEAVRQYRHHSPDIQLPPAHLDVLNELACHAPLYLVTDGHKVVQAKKVDALGIAPLFRKVYITHRYGIACAKPSAHCFDLIRRREGCDWHQMVYIGDNPAKDFVTLNRLGMPTIRVLTGCYAGVEAQPGYDARHSVARLTEVPTCLATLSPV